MEKYTSLLKNYKCVYAENSPVLICARALIKDNENGNIYAQLKFKNISDKNISALKIRITAFDAFGEEMGEDIKYQYLDMNEKRNAEFGGKKLVPLPDNQTRSFKVKCTEVRFSDGSVAKIPEETEWAEIPEQEKLSEKFGREIAEQYRRDTFEKAEFVPDFEKDIWRCACGAINRKTEQECHFCRNKKEFQYLALDEDELRAGLAEYKRIKAEEDEKARTEAQKKAEEAKIAAEKRKKKNTIIAAIAIPAAVILASAGIFFVNFAFGYSFEKGGEVLAKFENEEIFSEAKSLAAEEILESDYDFENEGFEIEKGIVSRKSLSDAKALSGIILENSEGIYTAEGFYIGGKLIGTTDSKESWEKILEEYKESFRREGDPSELSFGEEVEFVSGLYEIGTFMSTENFKVLLAEGKEGKVYHTVAEGESPSLIADMYGLYYSELTEMNPVLLEKPEVMTGDELLVSEKVPFIKVVSPLSDEELEHLLIYNEAKKIVVKDNATKNKLKELCGKLPEGYPGKADLLKKISDYEKKQNSSGSGSGGGSGNLGTGKFAEHLSKIQGTWVAQKNGNTYKIVVSGKNITVYENGSVYVRNGVKFNLVVDYTILYYDGIQKYSCKNDLATFEFYNGYLRWIDGPGNSQLKFTRA